MKKPNAKKNTDYKTLNPQQAKQFLTNAMHVYLERCGGLEGFFDFLQKEYDCDPVFWVRTARKLGFDIIKKDAKFYLKIEMNDTKRT